MSEDMLLVFLKAPRAGEVKTRLVPGLGRDDAARLYRVLAEAAVRETAPQEGEYRQWLFFSPADGRPEIEAWFPGVPISPQREGGTLGARMAQAFDTAFADGARRVALIGSDVPWLTRAHVRQALDALGDHDVSIGPSPDGGYYMLALRQHRPDLFRDVAWSTGDVLAQTFDRTRALGLRVHLLDPLPDVDVLEDVESEWPRLERLLDPALRDRVLRALDAAHGDTRRG